MADILRRTVGTGSEILDRSSRPTRQAPKVSRSNGKTKLRGGANIEGRISPRKVITQDSKGNQVQKEVDVKTANALLDIGAIVSLGNGFFLDADLALSADGVNVEDYKFGEGRIDRLGLGIGKKFDDGQIGVKGTYNPESRDATVGLGGSFKFNKGGEVQMQKQMEMFQDGGLNDQGGSKDPVSGNDVPSGSLKEEVRDDIDAKLSPGEFVFPADVVRFIGLEKLMLMRDKAKKGLSRMEEMGQMGNSDEATIDDDVPFGMEDLIIVAGPPDNEMSKGGVPKFVLGGVSQAGRGAQLLGIGGDNHGPLKYYDPKTNREITVSKIAGKFFPDLPEGYIRKPEQAETKPRDVKTETAKVDTELGSGERDGGPDAGDVSAGEMTSVEQANAARDREGPLGGFIGGVENVIGLAADFAPMSPFSKGLPGTLASKAMDVAPVPSMRDMIAKNNAAFSQTLAGFRTMNPDVMRGEISYAETQRATRSLNDYADSVGADPNDVGVPGTATVNGIEVDIATDKHGTMTVTGSPDIIGRSMIGDILGNTDQTKAAKEQAEKEAKETKEKAEATIGAQERGISGTTDTTETKGQTPGGGPEQESDVGGNESSAGRGGAGSGPDTGGFGGGVEGSKGGFIPKRKKQKKMKRGGLASR